MKQERFYPPEIIRDPNAGVKYFTPEKDDRDRFSNRLFSSPQLAYLDRSGDKVKAGLLVSPDGQAFIENNPKILQDIEYGLVNLEAADRGPRDNTIDIGEGRILEAIINGGQSNFYILIINGEKYAIKTHVAPKTGREELHQPYINEMLQTQSVATDLKDELDGLKVKMSTFLFASGQVSCTLFEEDAKNHDIFDTDKLGNLKNMLSRYILEQRYSKKNALWENVHVDLPMKGLQWIATVTNNFKTKPDGTAVWIDPFMYIKPASVI